MSKAPAWLEHLVSVINNNLSDEDKAHSIVLDNKAISKLTKKDYDYIWHQISILRLEILLKLQQQQLGKCITKRVPQYLIETIYALELCIDYHKYPTASKQQIARELAYSAARAVDSTNSAYSASFSASSAAWAAYSAAYSATNSAVDSTNSALAANSAYSAVDSAVYLVAKSAWAAALAASWKQEAIDLSKILNQLKR